MDIDTLISKAREIVDTEKTMALPQSWGQGRTVFGGVSAALLYTAMKSKIRDGRPLRSLTTNFVGPLLLDTPFSFEVEVLREGKNATQVTARIIQDGMVAVIQQGCFGNERFSNIEVPNHETHDIDLPAKCQGLPFIEGVTPNFLTNIDLSIAKGAMPYSGVNISQLYGWMRFKNEPGKITDAHLVCLIDAWPPAVLQMMKKPSPASTMMWNLEFIYPHDQFSPRDWFAYKAQTRQAAGGYAHLEADVWDASGNLVAISRQSVAIFE
ncbi:thioesterase family protein [Photobacterium sp. MCCC 1A19761]|uniref:acyl-CoA thioesterase n=1 Tax=Photobacterium sp. MCCC 1A19761 TaxID=3115000 RepID=UPI00307D8F2B